MDSIFTPRPKQAQVLAYRRGKMGVSAVPGSGKTWTLSLLVVTQRRERTKRFRLSSGGFAEVATGKIVLRLWPKYTKPFGGLHWPDDCKK